uniref:Uncharacterized protein n=1 Tax=Anopheles coluzzii TaxID=1518534 RepID=A0A8W7PKV7_ANOCL
MATEMPRVVNSTLRFGCGESRTPPAITHNQMVLILPDTVRLQHHAQLFQPLADAFHLRVRCAQQCRKACVLFLQLLRSFAGVPHYHHVLVKAKQLQQLVDGLQAGTLPLKPRCVECIEQLKRLIHPTHPVRGDRFVGVCYRIEPGKNQCQGRVVKLRGVGKGQLFDRVQQINTFQWDVFL